MWRLLPLCTLILAHEVSAELLSECTQSPLLLQHHLACPSPWRPSATRKQTPTPKSVKSSWKGKPSAPWDGPYDCSDKYCTYVNRHLNGGLVLISVEDNVHLIDQFPVLPTYSPSNSSDDAPFYAAQIPGKGVGLIARRAIRRNEVILRNTPAMLIQFGPHLDFSAAEREDVYAKAARLLPEPRRREFARQFGVTTFEKVDKNSFRLFINGRRNFSGHIGVYPDVSRMNHDCRPK